MGQRFHVVHDPSCSEPIDDHSGDEACLKLVPDDGNGAPVYIGPIGSPGISDIRDMRTGQEAYDELMAARNGVSRQRRPIKDNPQA